MNKKYMVPLNLSKLGYRYFRIILESKQFSKKFVNYVINHPNTGYVYEGSGWSGKKKVLGIGIWATNNAEITDIATHIRALIPEAYKVVYQSELTRLEFFAEMEGKREAMVLLDELDAKVELTPLQVDFLKLLSVDGSLTVAEQAALLGVSEGEVVCLGTTLRDAHVYYGVLENKPLPAHYTKFFVDTAALSFEDVERYYELLKHDSSCVYLARGNGKYNLEFEYVLADETAFSQHYGPLMVQSKRINFDYDRFTNLFPQSKFLNTKTVQDRFVELAKTNEHLFNLGSSELWYVNHDGTQAYLDIYSNPTYREAMKSGEVGIFTELVETLKTETRSFNVIDLGSGDGQKAKQLIEILGEEQVKAYFPVDIQALELAQAVRVHAAARYAVHPTVLGFNNLSARFPIPGTSEVNLYAMFGGTYGNFPVEEINEYLSRVLKNDNDKLLIAMPIRDFVTRQSITDSYLNDKVERVGLGVLKQIGFVRDDFMVNPLKPEVVMQLKWKDNRNIVSFTLKHRKHLLGLSLEEGTEFDVMSSWKPTLREFQSALETSFRIDSMLKNKSFAIAVCSRKND